MITFMAVGAPEPGFAFFAMIWATAIFQAIPVALAIFAAIRLRKMGWTMTFVGSAFVATSVWVFSSVGSFANLILREAFTWDVRPDELGYGLLLIGLALAIAGAISPIRKLIKQRLTPAHRETIAERNAREDAERAHHSQQPVA